ncbi:RnfH family protein [Candidatus Pantoea edessiphila]|uniref:UPF0125 protein CRV11_00125 n=1 Tax=Candidatus Pantoea edessiphila TaxID=2044610 RepID=A0A2P5SZ72_9GAMM|nr:RnfH family protein [Candidatus Pantoea edessiphila]MBK4775536.1 RnfH family protein [Pantoea sp. Edef]PPI87602.1 RnfH family protein [Candidatus Pantoea edessiphila]
MSVELIYALPQKQYHFHIILNNYSTVRQVIEKSGILRLHKEINIYVNKIGIYGKVVSLEDIVQQGDRIEIYRSLYMDPMELRRKRVKRTKK